MVGMLEGCSCQGSSPGLGWSGMHLFHLLRQQGFCLCEELLPDVRTLWLCLRRKGRIVL